MTRLQTTLVRVDALEDDQLAGWRELEEQAVEPNPFFSPELLGPGVRHLEGGRNVRLLMVREGSRVLLALPVVRAPYRRLPLRAATTWRHPYRYVGTPLVREDALHVAPAAALRALAGLAPWAVLEELYLDGPVARAFRAATKQRRGAWVEHDAWDRPAVHRRDEPTYLETTLSARSAKSLRRQRRALARDLGPVRSRDAASGADPASVRAEVDGFLAMEATGWKGAAGTAMACRPAHAAFLREACAALALRGRLELWRLDAGPDAVARQVHVRAGGTVFHLKTTYDQTWARASPGVQLELDVLTAFHEDRRLQLLDPCTDDEPGTSARLYPDRRRIGAALVGLRSAGNLAALGTPALAAAWRAVRP